MVEITNEELTQVIGGGKKSLWGVIGIAFGVIGTLIAGIIDGYLRPLTCNK